jgi:hypothetical protein
VSAIPSRARKQAFAVLLISAAICLAQPVITDLQPRGAQKGRPFTLTIVGRGMADGAKVESTLPASFTALGPQKGVMGALFLVEPSGEWKTGVYPVRVVTPDGISNVQLFSVGSFPEYAEDESRPGSLPNMNDTIETAQPLPSPPLTVNGKLDGPERDVYRISAKKGEKRTIEVEARRCGSAIDPVIQIEDSAGKLLGRSEDAPLLGLDARLDVTFPRDGYYYVVVHDSRYSTQKANFYRLKIGSYSHPEEIFPLGGRRGESVQVTLGREEVPVDLRNAGPDQHLTFVSLPDGPALPVPFAIGDDPEVTEPAAAVSAPVTINGRLAKAGDPRRYKVQVTPGDSLTIRVQARELGTSKLMGVISAFDEKGVKLAQAGDEALTDDPYNISQSRTAGDPELRLQVPTDVHTIELAVEDLARRGGPGYAYRLNVRPVKEDVRVLLATPYINVPAGGSTAVPLIVERHGYDGEVQLRVANPPAGLRVEGGHVPSIPASKEKNQIRSSEGVLILSSEEGAHLTASELTVEGTAGSLVRKAEGPGMMVAVSGASEQISVDRQRPVTASWLGMQLPFASTKPQPATLELSLIDRKRLAEGDEMKFRWKWKTSEPSLAFPKDVEAEMVGAADIRMIDAKPESPERNTGTFLLTTTKLTRPARYDLYITGRLMVDGREERVVSRPISVEVKELEPASADKTDSGR